ncbi:MAG TPA: DUF309 domain-containing protein [Tepidisphaeraceae bacterium]|jgi:hypothetical protein
MNLDHEKKLYYDGIQLFNEHDFFEAHEVWEDIWHMAFGLKHYFYQGMIQCAVALEHYSRSNPRGVISLHKTYEPKFANLPDPFMGLGIGAFLGAMRHTLSPVLDAAEVARRGEIELDESTVPKIVLLYDPFETGEAARYNHPPR